MMRSEGRGAGGRKIYQPQTDLPRKRTKLPCSLFALPFCNSACRTLYDANTPMSRFRLCHSVRRAMIGSIRAAPRGKTFVLCRHARCKTQIADHAGKRCHDFRNSTTLYRKRRATMRKAICVLSLILGFTLSAFAQEPGAPGKTPKSTVLIFKEDFKVGKG